MNKPGSPLSLDILRALTFRQSGKPVTARELAPHVDSSIEPERAMKRYQSCCYHSAGPVDHDIKIIKGTVALIDGRLRQLRNMGYVKYAGFKLIEIQRTRAWEVTAKGRSALVSKKKDTAA